MKYLSVYSTPTSLYPNLLFFATEFPLYTLFLQFPYRGKFKGSANLKICPVTLGIKIEICGILLIKAGDSMDMGDMTSREIGQLLSAGLINQGKELLEEQQGQVPGTAKKQNLGHNSKKESLGPNIKR